MKFFDLVDTEKIKAMVMGLARAVTAVNKKTDIANRKYDKLLDSFMRYSVINQPSNGLSSQVISISTTFGNTDLKDPSIKEFYFGPGSLLRYSRAVELDCQDPYELVNYESAMRISSHFINAQAGQMSGAFVSKTSTDPVETLTGSYIFQAMPGSASRIDFNDLDVHLENSRVFLKKFTVENLDVNDPTSFATVGYVNAKTSVLAKLQPRHAFGKISFSLAAGKLIASPTSAYQVEELQPGVYCIKLMHYNQETATGKGDSWTSLIGADPSVMSGIPGWNPDITVVPLPVDPTLIMDATIKLGVDDQKNYNVRASIPNTLIVGESIFNWCVTLDNSFICIILDTNGYIKIPGVPAVISIAEPVYDIRFYLAVSQWSYISNGQSPIKKWDGLQPDIPVALKFINTSGPCDITIEHNACGDSPMNLDVSFGSGTDANGDDIPTDPTNYFKKENSSARGSRLVGIMKPGNVLHAIGYTQNSSTDKMISILQDETLPIKIIDTSRKIGIRRNTFPIICSDMIKKRIEVKDAKLPLTLSLEKPDNVLATISQSVSNPPIGKNVIAFLDIDQITSELTNNIIKVIARDSRFFDFTQTFKTLDAIDLELGGAIGANITPDKAKLYFKDIRYAYQVVDTTHIKIIEGKLPNPDPMPNWYSKTFEIIVDTITYTGTITTSDGLKLIATPEPTIQLPVSDIVGKKIKIDGVEYLIASANDATQTPGVGTPVFVFIDPVTPLPPPNPMPYLYENSTLRFVSVMGEDIVDIEVEIV